ncbi:MAG: translation initiation factor IF-2 [bacterium]|nr:translation initiation factor IF-2 [bacterium]
MKKVSSKKEDKNIEKNNVKKTKTVSDNENENSIMKPEEMVNKKTKKKVTRKKKKVEVKKTIEEIQSEETVVETKNEDLTVKEIHPEVENTVLVEEPRPIEPPESKKLKKIDILFNSTVKEISELTEIPLQDLIKTALTKFGKPISINQKLDSDFIELLLLEFGFEAQIKMPYEIKIEGKITTEKQPVITVMGHVDHGKTTLLDTIRKTNVASKEYAGITQKIGAYEVSYAGKKITFIDTPGHEAFTAMRARGANVTDIVILVVSAEDGVMPQTIEAIYHARSANVPIIVAINKIDSPRANPEKVKNQLAEYGLIPEEWGGKNIFIEISAKTGKNIDKLLEAILFQAELLGLKSFVDVPARGVVIESHKDSKRGVVATLVIKDGILKNGNIIWAGSTYGKIKAIFDFSLNKLNEAKPGQPVEILGLEDVPEAGDYFLVQDSLEKAAQLASEYSKRLKRETKQNIFELFKDKKEKINVIIKCDYYGSLEAIENSFSNYDINIVAKGVGNITSADVLLASASKAIVIGFSVDIEEKAQQAAKNEAVTIATFRSIYEITDYIKQIIEGKIEKIEVEKKIGTLKILKRFELPSGIVAGCRVDEGYVKKGAKVKIIRENSIKTGAITSLRIFKDPVNEVKQGFECGVKFDFDDFKENEVVEVYEIEKT